MPCTHATRQGRACHIAAVRPRHRSLMCAAASSSTPSIPAGRIFLGAPQAGGPWPWPWPGRALRGHDRPHKQRGRGPRREGGCLKGRAGGLSTLQFSGCSGLRSGYIPLGGRDNKGVVRYGRFWSVRLESRRSHACLQSQRVQAQPSIPVHIQPCHCVPNRNLNVPCQTQPTPPAVYATTRATRQHSLRARSGW